VKPFEYERAADADGAVALMARPGAKYLGGGTNLVDLMKLGVETPDLLVDVSRLPYTAVEETAAGGLLVGAALRNSDLAADPRVRERYPALSRALLAGASGQLRNAATVGGNLLQRTRCRYFQDVTKPCNKRLPGTGCPAREGEHRNLAILGASEACVATHPSDMAVALAALDAVVHLHGGDSVPVVDLHRLPGDTPQVETTLPAGALITGIELPALPMARRSTYRKVRDRASYAFAVASIAAALDLADGTVRDVRIAYGALAHKPWRAYRAEAALRGGPASRDAFRAAADAELAAATPLRDNAFKVPLVRNLTAAVLAELAEADR
jgi:xanthine dehydrogenase YagS FAD-binding subunit